MAIDKATAEIYKKEIVSIEKSKKGSLTAIIIEFVIAGVFLILGIVWNINLIWVTALAIVLGIVCIVMYNVHGKKIRNRQAAISQFEREEKERLRAAEQQRVAAEPVKQEAPASMTNSNELNKE